MTDIKLKMDKVKIVRLEELVKMYKIKIEDFSKEYEPPIKRIERQTRIVSEETKKIISRFKKTLTQIKKDSGYDLTMKGRRIFFQDIETINDETEQEKQKLRERYHGLTQKGGDCARDEKEGIFVIRVAASEKEKNLCPMQILEYLSHEYGHTLGERLKDVFEEELKAYAFSSLFFRYFLGESLYKKDSSSYEEGIHKMAQRELGKILRAGLSEEVVISHLIKEKFGKAKPTDLFDFFLDN